MRVRTIIRGLAIVSVLVASLASNAQDAKPEFKAKPEVQVLIDAAKEPAKAFKWDEVLKIYGDALKKAEELGDLYGQGVAWQKMGNTFYSQGNLLKAKDAFEHAKDLYGKAGDSFDEMGMLGNLAIMKDNMGYPNEARPIYLQLLGYYREHDDKKGVARMLLNLAILENGVDSYSDALKYGLEARDAFKALGDKKWEAGSLGAAAQALSGLGRRSEAIASYEEVVLIARAGGFKQEEAQGLGSLGGIYREQGDQLKALDALRACLKLREETNDIRHYNTVLVSMGIVYDMLGQSRLGISNIEQAVAGARKIGDRPGLAYALNNLGVMLEQAKLDDKAMPVLKEALALDLEIGDKFGQAASYGTIGAIQRRQKKYKESIENHQRSAAIFHELGQREEEATVFDSVANVLVDQGHFAEAMANFNRAIAIYSELGNRRFAASTYGNIGRALMKEGKLDAAEASYRTCIDYTEDIRSRLGASSEGKAEFLGRRVEVYHDYMSLLVRRGRAAEAFNLAQKTKGRTLLDLLSNGNIALQQEMTDSEKAEEHRLRNKADEINARMLKEGAQNEVGAKKRFAALQVELQSAENQLAAFTAALFVKHPGLAQKRSAGTASLAQVAARLPKNTAILEFVQAEKPLVFVVTARGGKPKVTPVQLAVSSDDLDKLASQFRASLSDPTLDYKASSAKLYGVLIKPLAPRLTDIKRLVVCPDGSLWDVPFAALSNGRFLAERFEIDYAYSATAFEAMFRPRVGARPSKSLLVLANPDFGGAKRFGDSPLVPGQRPIEPPSRPIEPPSRPIEPPSRPIEPPSRDLSAGLRAGIAELPGTQQEADALARLFPGADLLTRKQAQETAFMTSAGKYRYIHIASHAFFNDAAPMLSSIVLANPSTPESDGYLTARELFGLKLNADLVVLSACNTARGEKRSGEGIVGLSWALFAAGAPAQVVSQWSVDDKATATLMTRFYRNLKDGQSKGAALRNSSLSLLKGTDKKWKHPYYWAPFILLGDWR